MTNSRPALGRVGVWTWAFDGLPWARITEPVAELDELGYGAIWFGEARGREATTQSALLLGATRRMVVAPGVVNIYRHDPRTLAQAERALAEAYPGRFLLGLGVGVREINQASGHTWKPPLGAMREYLDAMDAAPLSAPGPASPPWRVLGALGPRMLRLAGERTAGAHPFLMPVEHTAYAREILGPDALLAVHQAVVLDGDPAEARRVAREHLARSLERASMVPSRWRAILRVADLDESDLAGRGSDRLADALYATGDLDAVAKRVRAQFDAGADHVCIGITVAGSEPRLGLEQLRRLAPALLEP